MKIIEAMKLVKSNLAKIDDLKAKVAQNSATTNMETPMYGDKQKETVEGWLQSIFDLSQDNISLLIAIQRTNLMTKVPIEIGGNTITRSIAEWVHRRRTYAMINQQAWAHLTDRGIKEGHVSLPGQTEKVELKVIRHFDPTVRDNKVSAYRDEPYKIDSTLEVINATTDLITADLVVVN